MTQTYDSLYIDGEWVRPSSRRRIADFLQDYARAWEQDAPEQDPEQRIESWVQRLYDLAQQNRTLLITSVARRAVGKDADHDVVDALADMLEGLQELTKIQSEAHAYYLDAPVSVGAAAAMVIGTVLLQDLVFPRGTERPDRERVVDEVTTVILHGISHRSAIVPETI